MNPKGISPLIASVLLIAFTMSIAGIMATWATSFSTERLDKAACAFVLEIRDATYSGGNITLRVASNIKSRNLSDLRASLLYDDQSKNVEDILLKNYGAADPLTPFGITTAFITNVTKPAKVEVRALSCPGTPSILNIV